jgi:hypothetical protein
MITGIATSEANNTVQNFRVRDPKISLLELALFLKINIIG